MTTFLREINDFGGPEPPKMSPNEAQKAKNYDKIAMKTPTTDKDDQKYAPRPSRRRTWRPKRPTAIIDLPVAPLIFWALGPPKVF